MQPHLHVKLLGAVHMASVVDKAALASWMGLVHSCGAQSGHIARSKIDSISSLHMCYCQETKDKQRGWAEKCLLHRASLPHRKRMAYKLSAWHTRNDQNQMGSANHIMAKLDCQQGENSPK